MKVCLERSYQEASDGNRVSQQFSSQRCTAGYALARRHSFLPSLPEHIVVDLETHRTIRPP